MGERRGEYKVLVGKPEGKRTLGRPRVDGKIILRWIFRKWNGGMYWVDPVQGRVRWRVLCGTETSGAIKCGDFLTSS